MVAVAVQEETETIFYRGPDLVVTSAVAVIRPRTLHLLQPDFAAGTCLEGTGCDNLKNIQRWMNVTKLYGPIFTVVTRWFYGFRRIGGSGWPLTSRGKRVANSVEAWEAWLEYHNADGSDVQLLKVAIEMRNALEVSNAERDVELRRQADAAGTTQPMVIARLLNPVEYARAQGNPGTPLFGDPSEDKVAISGRSASLLNLDWAVRNPLLNNKGGAKHPPPRGYVESYDTSDQAKDDRLARHFAAKAGRGGGPIGEAAARAGAAAEGRGLQEDCGDPESSGAT